MNADILLGIIMLLILTNTTSLQAMFDYKRKYKDLSRSITNSDLWYDTDSRKFFKNENQTQKNQENGNH